MANRFLNPVQSEYVPQYTPDIIDPQTAIEAAKNKQGRYDLALSAASNDFINPEYVALGENNEIAQQKIKEYSDWQESIMSDLTNDKDVSKAAREIIKMNQAYNTDPDLERLRTNSVTYKENVANILKGKNANSNATLLEYYKNQFSNTPFKDELGQYGEVPNAVAGDPLDFATFVPHIKALVAEQGIPITDKNGQTIRVKGITNEQGQLIAYDIQTGKKVSVDGELVREATKKFIQSNPMYQAALPTHNILFGEEGNETMLDTFVDAVGSMMNKSDITYKDNIMQVGAGEESTGYSPPQEALDSLSYRNVQVPNVVAENSETANSADLEARLNVQKIALTTNPEIAESAATLAEAFQSLGVEIADPRYNGTNQSMAFQPINYNLEEAVNSGTNIKQAFMEQGTLQTMNDDLFLTGEELEAIQNPILKDKAYKANQLLIRKNSEAILYNSVKMKQNELLFEAQNGPLSNEEMLSASKLQNSLDTDDFETAEEIVLQYTDLDEKQKKYLDEFSKGTLVKSGVFYTPEGDEEYTTDDFSKEVLEKIGMEEVDKYGLSLNDLYAAIKYYENPVKTTMRPNMKTGPIGQDPLPLPIPKDKYEQFVSLYQNDPSVQNARKDVSKSNYKKYIKTLFAKEKEDSFARKWADSRDRYDAKVQETFTNKISNALFRDYSNMSGTTNQKNAWVTTGASTIQSYADGLTKRLEDPAKVMNFLAGGRVYDMATGEDVTMSIQLKGDLRSLVTRDYNDESKNTANGSYAIGNYNFSYGGITNIPDVGNAVMLNVTRKVGENEKASTESYNLLVTGPEVDQMANFQQVEKYKLMTNTDQGAKYNSEAVGEYNDILNDLTNLMNQTHSNSISKYPAGIAEVKLEDEKGRITYGKKQIFVDITPKPDGLTFILNSYYLDNTGNKMTYGNIITSDNLSLSDIAADIAAQYIQIK